MSIQITDGKAEVIKAIAQSFIEQLEQNGNEIPDHYERLALKDFLVQIYQLTGGTKPYKVDFSWEDLLIAEQTTTEA